jgi:hypothetical protein
VDAEVMAEPDAILAYRDSVPPCSGESCVRLTDAPTTTAVAWTEGPFYDRYFRVGTMMIDGRYLQEIRGRWEAVRDMTVEVISSRDGRTKLLLRHGVTSAELRVTREGEPAADGDVLFVGHAFSDIPRLLVALESGSHLPAEETGDIGSRVASASPGPWTAFMESDGGTGGSDVIRVSER